MSRRLIGLRFPALRAPGEGRGWPEEGPGGAGDGVAPVARGAPQPGPTCGRRPLRALLLPPPGDSPALRAEFDTLAAIAPAAIGLEALLALLVDRVGRLVVLVGLRRPVGVVR